MFSAIKERILAPPPTKPVKQQDHRSNTWAVLPQAAPIRYRLLTGYPQRASKQMGWFTFYSLFPPLKLFCFTAFIHFQINSPLFPFSSGLRIGWLYALTWWLWYSCLGTSCLGQQLFSATDSISLSTVSYCSWHCYFTNITKGQPGPPPSRIWASSVP